MKSLGLMSVLEAPVISEKSTYAAENYNQVIFKVKRSASKQQVKRAVEMMFEVQVDSVHTLNVKGKSKRFGKFTGVRSDWKKAYVKLKPGFDIGFATA
jgi:large subunit ribosomal protein L23